MYICICLSLCIYIYIYTHIYTHSNARRVSKARHVDSWAQTPRWVCLAGFLAFRPTPGAEVASRIMLLGSAIIFHRPLKGDPKKGDPTTQTT